MCRLLRFRAGRSDVTRRPSRNSIANSRRRIYLARRIASDCCCSVKPEMSRRMSSMSVAGSPLQGSGSIRIRRSTHSMTSSCQLCALAGPPSMGRSAIPFSNAVVGNQRRLSITTISRLVSLKGPMAYLRFRASRGASRRKIDCRYLPNRMARPVETARWSAAGSWIMRTEGTSARSSIGFSRSSATSRST